MYNIFICSENNKDPMEFYGALDGVTPQSIVDEKAQYLATQSRRIVFVRRTTGNPEPDFTMTYHPQDEEASDEREPSQLEKTLAGIGR